jgi:hypothetical protein
MNLWIDDVREMPRLYDVHAKTAQEAILLLKSGKIKRVSFDHDLGPGKTGYDVAKWIIRQAHDGEMGPIAWAVHSNNTVGRNNIRETMEQADKIWREQGLL